MVHEDTKIISEIGPRDAESVHARENQDVASCNQSVGDIIRRFGLQERMSGLGTEGTFIAILGL